MGLPLGMGRRRRLPVCVGANERLRQEYIIARTACDIRFSC